MGKVNIQKLNEKLQNILEEEDNIKYYIATIYDRENDEEIDDDFQIEENEGKYCWTSSLLDTNSGYDYDSIEDATDDYIAYLEEGNNDLVSIEEV